MAIKEDDLLTYAKSLASEDASECQLRASMSRSYYAAFHSLLPLVQELPPSANAVGRDVNHFEVTERLVEWRVESLCPALKGYRDIKARAQRAMDAARAKRIIADYRLGQDVSFADTLGQINRVEQVIRATHNLLAVVEQDRGVATGSSTA